MGQDVARGLLLGLGGSARVALCCVELPHLDVRNWVSSHESFMKSHACVSPRRFSKPFPKPDVPSTQ